MHRWPAFAVLAVAYFMTIVDLSILSEARRSPVPRWSSSCRRMNRHSLPPAD